MGEVFTKNFFTIGTVKAGESKCFIPGVAGDVPDLWECEPEIWKWDEPVKIKCASLVLLTTAPADRAELYACVCRKSDIDPNHNFAAMKKEHLFYVQRDAYASCRGISDLGMWQPLPEGDYFTVSKEKPIYVKAGVINCFTDRTIDFDVIVNLIYERC